MTHFHCDLCGSLRAHIARGDHSFADAAKFSQRTMSDDSARLRRCVNRARACSDSCHDHDTLERRAALHAGADEHDRFRYPGARSRVAGRRTTGDIDRESGASGDCHIYLCGNDAVTISRRLVRGIATIAVPRFPGT